jgi:multiple sugar transport system substrate-binding protein
VFSRRRNSVAWRHLRVATAVLTVVVLVGSCSNSGGNADPGGSAASDAPVEFLDLPYSPQTVPMYQQAAKDFEAQTNTKVNVSQVDWDTAHSKFLSLIQARQQPDIAVFGPKWLPEFIELDVLQPLDSYLPKEFFDQFPKALLDQVTFDGHIWALPEALSTRLMYYRTDLLEKEGISPPKTWAEFLDAAKKLNNPPNQYGFVEQGSGDEMIWYYTYFLYGAGGRYTDANGKWAVNQPANVEALQFEVDLANKHKVTQPNPTGSGLDTAQQLFVKGNTAMYWGPPWILSIIKQQNPELLDKVAVTDYPTKTGEPAPLFIQDVFVMFKGAKNPEGAAKFLEFWSKDQYQIKFNATESLIPVTTSAGKAPEFTNDERVQRFVASIPYSISYPVQNGWSVVNTEVNKAIQAAFLGTPAKEALDRAQQEIDRQTTK